MRIRLCPAHSRVQEVGPFESEFAWRPRVHPVPVFGIGDGEDWKSPGAVEAKGRHMNETAILEWLPQLQRIAVALVIGFVPALIARWKRRAMMPWYLYGFVCGLLAWPAVALPAIHALLVRSHGKPEQISQKRRRKSALALLKEESVRSYPSWIAELKGKSPAGMELRSYAYEQLQPGEALVLFRERTEPGDKHAVSYRHGDVHLGYVPGDTAGLPTRLMTGFAFLRSSKALRRAGSGGQHSSARGLSFYRMAANEYRGTPHAGGLHTTRAGPVIEVAAA
jgi:hypothetical protein